MKKFIVLFLVIVVVSIIPFSFGCGLSYPSFQVAEQDPEGAREEAKKQAQKMIDKEKQISEISKFEVFRIVENKDDYIIIDVRTKEEYNSGHIEGALSIPMEELRNRFSEITKGKQIIVYGQNENRSRRAAETLIDNGFTYVSDMGTIDNWTGEDYPLISE